MPNPPQLARIKAPATADSAAAISSATCHARATGSAGARPSLAIVASGEQSGEAFGETVELAAGVWRRFELGRKSCYCFRLAVDGTHDIEADDMPRAYPDAVCGRLPIEAARRRYSM